MKDQPTKNRFVELRAKNWSFDKISKEINVSKPVLIAWSRELSIEVANAKSLELDLLQEKFALSTQHRLESHGQMLEKLNAEIKKRDFADLETSKLIELTLKFAAAIEKENLPIQFKKEETQILPDNCELWDGRKVIKSWEA